MPNLLQGIGQAQPVTGFINTALHVQQSQNQTALMEQQQKLNELKLAQDERNNEYLDVTEVLRKAQEKGHGGAVDLGIKRSMDLGLHKEVAGPDGTSRTFMRRSDIAAGVDAISQDTKAQPAILADRENYLTTQMDALEKKAGDPKFKAQYDELAAERRMVRKKLYGLDEDKGTVVPAGATLVRPGQENFTAPAEPKLGAAVAESESGDIFYNSPKGLVSADNTPYDPQVHGALAKPIEPAAPKDTINDFATYYRGEKEKNPNITESQISEGWHKLKLAEQMAAARVRGEGFAASRPVQVLDTKNGNAPAILSLADVNEANKFEKGRYIPIGSSKALGQTALIEDIRGAIENTRGSLKNLKTDFTASQAAQIALIMKQRDPRSATSAFIGTQVGQTLSPEQVDYVTDLAQLIENGMAMRSVLGAGQGSDELRSAIMATIPSAKTPNRAYAYKQLDKFEQQINRLSAGIPKVQLRTDVGPTRTSTGPTIVETRTLKDGTTWDKLSDGTFRQVK